MRTLQISEILKMSDGETIPGITGTIDWIGERKTGTGQYGEWSFQPASIVQGTDKIKVTLKNRPAIQFSKGDSISILCQKTDKHGLQGIKLKIGEYNGQEQRELITTTGALLERSGEAPIADQVHQESIPDDKQADKILSKCVNLMIRCLDAGEFIRESCTKKAYDISQEHFQAMAHSIFIESNKQGIMNFMSDKISKTEPKTEPSQDYSQDDLSNL